MRRAISRRVHTRERGVLTIPLGLGTQAIRRGNDLNGVRVNDAQIVGANAQEFGVVVSMQAEELVVAVEVDVAEDGVEF